MRNAFSFGKRRAELYFTTFVSACSATELLFGQITTHSKRRSLTSLMKRLHAITIALTTTMRCRVVLHRQLSSV